MNTHHPRYVIPAFFLSAVLFGCIDASGQQLFTANQAPTAEKMLAPRPLQYWPEGDSIVCLDGTNRFTRALYGRCEAARLETCDMPEFGLYMPYMGGNLKFEVEYTHCKASYDGASRDYCLSLPASWREDAGREAYLHISALALQQPTVGGIWKVTGENVRPNMTFKVRYGAANNASFSRNGDLGADKPDCFDFTLEKCKGNQFIIDGEGFTLSYGKGSKKGERQMAGLFPAGSRLQLVETEIPSGASQGTLVSYLEVDMPVSAAGNIFAIGLNRLDKDLQAMYVASENAICQVLGDFDLQTPDAFINPLGYCIPAAANGIWDEESGVWQHGAIGWRMPLPGWRAGYVGDVLGWSDRARRHFEGYAASQLVDVPVNKDIPVLDASKNLARAVEKLGNPMFTTGYIGRYPNNPTKVNHYDMNLVFIDELLWHLNWTGDLEEAEHFWPTIERHLDWEKRTFDPDDDGLYDAYCCIWASDGLYYSGGAVTHSSAYNLRANRQASAIASLLGKEKESQKFAKEADRIQRAMDKSLWLEDKGVWAECRDKFGLKRAHENPALWTIYHAIDSEVGSPLQRYRATQYVDEMIPHVPLLIEGDDHGMLAQGEKPLSVISTTNWQPYGWSINNVALAEEMHTALAYWEAGRPDEAYQIFKGALMDGMYLGASPGNIGQISQFDAARGECYRDFGDPVGITARTLVQGLIGMRPDLLHGVLTICPGFPSSWDGQEVSFRTDDYELRRSYQGDSAVWYFMGNGEFFDRYDSIVFVAPGKCILAGELADSEGVRFVDADSLKADILAQLQQLPTASPGIEQTMFAGPYTSPEDYQHGVEAGQIVPVKLQEHRKATIPVKDIFRQHYSSPRNKTVTLSMPTQGIGEWCHPTDTFLVSTGDLPGEQGVSRVGKLESGAKAQFVSLWKNFPDRLSFKLPKRHASRVYLKMCGTTNPMQSRIVNGVVRVRYTDGTCDELQLINPINWWPVEQELVQGMPTFYLRQYGEDVDPPYRMSLRTGRIYRPDARKLNASTDGGAANLLELPLNPAKTLKRLELECHSNDVVIGLMEVSLQIDTK